MLYAATFSFADIPEDERPGFSLIVDEFQNFATDDYAKLFSQGRKFKVKQFLAHQYRGQLSDTTSSDNRDATLTAGTKVIFRVSEPDSRALGSLFLDIGQRRRPVDLAIDPLDRLERHPNPVVKEFAAKYVWPLQAGSRDRMGTRKKFTWTFLKPDYPYEPYEKEVSYRHWCELMKTKDVIRWEVRSSHQQQEILKRMDSPKEGRDYEVVPAYPERDFGAGKTLFSPDGLQKALQTLNTLLYETQKSGINCYGVKDAETQLSQENYRVYRRHEQSAAYLEWALAPMFRFDDWLIAWDKANNEQRLQMLDDAMTGRRPDLYKSYVQLYRWRTDLQRCIDVLIREPVDQGGSDVRPADVAQSLQHLPLRQAFVRIGTKGHIMQTQQLTPGVDPDEWERRRLQIRKQTQKTLCRYVPGVLGVREEAPVSEQPAPAAPEPARPQTTIGVGAPLIRRSRPLS